MFGRFLNIHWGYGLGLITNQRICECEALQHCRDIHIRNFCEEINTSHTEKLNCYDVSRITQLLIDYHCCTLDKSVKIVMCFRIALPIVS